MDLEQILRNAEATPAHQVRRRLTVRIDIDYTEAFWQELSSQLDHGVSILQQGQPDAASARRYGLRADAFREDTIEVGVLLTGMLVATQTVPPMVGVLHLQHHMPVLGVRQPLLVDANDKAVMVITRLPDNA